MIKQSVLIVDDAPENIKIIGKLLNSDYIIRAATNGEEALKIAMSDTPPDLILLDVEMPEMNGYEVCRKLKESPATESIPVIFLTAKTESDDIVKGFHSGAVDYVTKPYKSVELNARVQTHLKLKRIMDEEARLVVQLKDALSQVKQLSGIIPICANCKKIRNDEGYWEQVETYIRDHSEAMFSHGLCPDCVRKLYPDMADEILKKQKKGKD